MDNILYTQLKWFPIVAADPAECHANEGRKAVELAHAAEIEQIVTCLNNRQSVLVLGDKALAPYVEQCLADYGFPSKRLKQVTYNPGQDSHPGMGTPSSVVPRLMASLAEQMADSYAGTPAPVVTLRHLDLMTWTAADIPRPELNDVIYYLTEYSDVIKLAFWDPVYTLPKIVEDLFPNRVSLQIFARENLWKLVSPQEARKISPSPIEFTLSAQLALYQYLSGTNVLNVRRVLRDVAKLPVLDCTDPSDTDEVFQHIRKSISPGAIQPTANWGAVEGYKPLREELWRRVIFPVKKRNRAHSSIELRQADALIPRGVILYGPPGTGKTEWAKWLAKELGASLLIVHGPELKHRLVGETEAAIRRLFAQARRTAPALILIDELDALTPSRTTNQSNFESSMVAQFLTEMDGLHKDEAVLVVGTTNRLESVDSAFTRPSRFGVTIEVDYPDAADRRAILEFYNSEKQFTLGLTSESIDYLVQATEPSRDPMWEAAEQYHDAYIEHVIGKKFYDAAGSIMQQQLRERFGLGRLSSFSGDHLRAICLYLLREALYRREELKCASDVNDLELLAESVRSVREHASPQLDATPEAERPVPYAPRVFNTGGRLDNL